MFPDPRTGGSNHPPLESVLQVRGMEGQFGGGRWPREDPHEEILNELLRGGSLDRHGSEWVIVAEPDEPGRHDAVCENGGLQGIGRGIADTRRVLPGTPPAKRRQHVGHGLQPGQGQTVAAINESTTCSADSRRGSAAVKSGSADVRVESTAR